MMKGRMMAVQNIILSFIILSCRSCEDGVVPLLQYRDFHADVPKLLHF